MGNSFDWSLNLVRAATPMFFSILVLGCGYTEYETRLNESKKYFAYLEKVEQSLAPKWVVEGNLMELRVPRQFVLMPAPEPAENPDEVVDKNREDPRMPDYLHIKLPGLFGAWQSQFTVVKPTGTEECKGYLYALSNYQELLGANPSDALSFVDSLKSELAKKLNVEEKEEPKEVFPKGLAMYQYQSQVSYDVCSFKGAEINGTKYTFDVYSRAQGNIIGVIIVVLPVDFEMPQKVHERLPLMLASFNFTKEPPSPAGQGGSTGRQTPSGAGF